MNDERYIIARFKAKLIQKAAEQKKLLGYSASVDLEDVLSLLAAIEATAVLDMEVDEILDPKVPIVEEAENA